MHRFLLPACALFALLAGCATYHAKPLVPAKLARQFEDRSLASDALHAYLAHELGHDLQAWPLPQWDARMLVLAAYYYSPALDIARAQWGTAKAGIDVADAIPNPVLQLPFQYSTPSPGPGLPYTVGPALDIPIETAHKRGYRVDQASHLSEAARLNIGTAAWRVRARVRSALLALYAAQQRAVLMARQADAERHIAAMITKRSSLGESSGPDANAAELAATQAQADLAAAHGAERDARARLAAAIGVPAAALDGIQFNFKSFEELPTAPSSALARDDAILHRTDLLASLARYAAAESALQLEIAKQYPDIHLGPGYTYDTGTHKIAFGLAGITLPIFDRNQGGIAQAEAKRKEEAARTAALQDTILGDLAHALAHYQDSRSAVHLFAKRLELARRQLDDQAASFAAGDTDRVALARARAVYQASAIAHLDAMVAAQGAAGLLEDALQRPLASPAANDTFIQQEIAR